MLLFSSSTLVCLTVSINLYSLLSFFFFFFFLGLLVLVYLFLLSQFYCSPTLSWLTGFFFLGWGGPPIWQKFCQSPLHPTLIPIFGPRLVPPPIRLHPCRGPTGTANFESPHQKFREKTLWYTLLLSLEYMIVQPM